MSSLVFSCPARELSIYLGDSKEILMDNTLKIMQYFMELSKYPILELIISRGILTRCANGTLRIDVSKLEVTVDGIHIFMKQNIARHVVAFYDQTQEVININIIANVREHHEVIYELSDEQLAMFNEHHIKGLIVCIFEDAFITENPPYTCVIPCDEYNVDEYIVSMRMLLRGTLV